MFLPARNRQKHSPPAMQKSQLTTTKPFSAHRAGWSQERAKIRTIGC